MFWTMKSWRRGARTEWERITGLEGRETVAYIDLVVGLTAGLIGGKGMSVGVAEDRVAILRPPMHAWETAPRVTWYPRSQVTFERVDARVVQVRPVGRGKAFSETELTQFLARAR